MLVMASACNNPNQVKELDYVILRSEVVNRLVQIRHNKPLFLGKRKVHVYSAVGQCFGSYFEIQPNGKLLKVSPCEADSRKCSVTADRENETKDNRLSNESGVSQKLTTDDIEAFKKQGISGHEMVKIIVENSTSFNDKTAFSKEKYLRKKQKKYVNVVQMLRPTVRLLAEMYYSQSPLKISNLRIDSLSQMLTFCNVMSGGKYIVIESVMGLLTAAVFEQLGLNGCVVQIHFGPFSVHHSQDAVKALNMPETHVQSVVYNIDFKSAMSLHQVIGDGTEVKREAENMDVDSAETDTNPFSERKRLKAEREDHIQKARDILSSKDLDSLLVAVKNHPSNVLPFLDFLTFSRPFAIFSMYQEPLVDCYVTLKARGDIIHLNISETWVRKYQVLADRTHPFYNMSGHGGFLLTGIKVEAKPQHN